MAWYNSNWNSRRSITLSPTTSIADYQVKVVLTGTTLTGAQLTTGNANGNDIRFTGPDGTTLQNHWIESWNASGTIVTATIWIKVTTSGTSNIYIYYGNSGAANASSGTNTFNFYDDFTGNTYRETGWINTDATKFSLVNNELKITNFYNNSNNQMYNTNTRVANIGQNFEMQFDAKCILGAWDPWLLVGLRSGTVTANNGPFIGAAIRGGGTSGNIELYYVSPSQSLAYGTNINAKNGGVTGNRFYYTLRSYNGTATLYVYSDSARTTSLGSSTYSYTAFTPSIVDFPNYLHYGAVNDNYYSAVYMDNIRIRNYISPDPVLSIIGTEEVQANIAATDITLDHTTPCIEGTCIVTANVTWTNSGTWSGDFVPNIKINGNIQTPIYPSQSLAAGNSVTKSFSIIGLPIGTHTICPYPN